MLQADALPQAPQLWSRRSRWGPSACGRRYTVVCMCFVWVPFRDTKYVLLLHFYDTHLTFDFVLRTSTCTNRGAQEHSEDFSQIFCARLVELGFLL